MSNPTQLPTQPLRIAAVQMNTQADKQANLTKAGALIDEAARLGAHWVALPEMFNMQIGRAHV